MPVYSANDARFHVQWLEPEQPDRNRVDLERQKTGLADGAGAAGRTPLVVFVHGLVMDNLSSFYYTLAGPVMSAGARVLLYDLRGHGRSERTLRGYSTSAGAADLIALLAASGVTEPAYLVSNSFGGLIAAQAALAAPDRIAGLALIEACCAGAPAAAWLEDMVNTLSAGALSLEYHQTAAALLAAGQRKLGRMAITAQALLNETDLIEELAAERPLDATELGRISCPVLAVYGDQSDLLGGADDLRRHVADCDIKLIPGLAHTVLRDATGTLRAVLLDWLSRHGAAPAFHPADDSAVSASAVNASAVNASAVSTAASAAVPAAALAAEDVFPEVPAPREEAGR